MMHLAIAITPDIEALIGAGAPVTIGVSGGKDSQAAALATFDHLNAIGHRGPRVLIHSDLGSVEWNASLPICRELAEYLGAEKRITNVMLYVKGWMLTDEEAGIPADVRTHVSRLLGVEAQYLDVPSIHHRYADLMATNNHRAAQAA